MELIFLKKKEEQVVKISENKERLYLTKELSEHFKVAKGKKLALALNKGNIVVIDNPIHNEWSVATPANGNSYISLGRLDFDIPSGSFSYTKDWMPTGDEEGFGTPYIIIQLKEKEDVSGV